VGPILLIELRGSCKYKLVVQNNILPPIYRLSFSVGTGSIDLLFLGHLLHSLPELYFLVKIFPQAGLGIGKLVPVFKQPAFEVGPV
jgi:hypothetical protein